MAKSASRSAAVKRKSRLSAIHPVVARRLALPEILSLFIAGRSFAAMLATIVSITHWRGISRAIGAAADDRPEQQDQREDSERKIGGSRRQRDRREHRQDHH